MAITGTGSQADPFIVHSYDELKTACLTTGIALLYIELANDINCNEYSTDFEWECVRTSGTLGIGFDLNLKGFAIKNVKIKSTNFMFQAVNASKIHDGKILNIFLSGAYGLSMPVTNTLSTIFTFENVSFSINGIGAINRANWDGSVAYCTKFVNCALYYDDTSSSKSSFAFVRDSAYAFENCDIKINKDGGGFTIANGTAQSCRFTGKISSSTASAQWIASTCTNSVIDVDFSGCTGGGSSAIVNSGTNNVCNTDTFTTHTTTSGIIPCTTEEIRNGDALRAKGFTVINVVA